MYTYYLSELPHPPPLSRPQHTRRALWGVRVNQPHEALEILHTGGSVSEGTKGGLTKGGSLHFYVFPLIHVSSLVQFQASHMHL